MFESCMWTYMKEEKELLLNLLQNHNVQENIDSLKEIEALYCVAHGSSFNACNAISSIISKYAKVRCYVYTPSNFENNALSLQFENPKTTAVLGISQTGTSRGVLEALDKVKDFKKITITNEKDSPVDKQGDVTYYLQVNEEDSNAKTKGFSATLLILILFALELAYTKGNISLDQKNALLLEVEKEISNLDQIIENTISWCEKNQYGKGMEQVYVVGSGVNYGSALEGQLKLMETMCIPTMFNDIGEFSHGMHRSLKSNSYVILLNAQSGQDLMVKTFEYCKEKNIPVLMINGEEDIDDEGVLNVGRYRFTASVFSIITTIQAISAYVPEVNGFDPNRKANDDYTDWMTTRV